MNPNSRRSKRLWQSGRVRVFASGVLWAVVMIVAYQRQLPILVRNELATVDARFRLRGIQSPAPEIVILGINEQSYAADLFRDDEDILRRCPDLRLLTKFPFDRRAYASAIRRLHSAGAKVVALDLMFLQPALDPSQDDEFKIAIERFHKQLVIGSNFSNERKQLDIPSDSVVPTNLPMNTVAGYVNYWSDADQFVRHALAVDIRIRGSGGRPLPR